MIDLLYKLYYSCERFSTIKTKTRRVEVKKNIEGKRERGYKRRGEFTKLKIVDPEKLSEEERTDRRAFITKHLPFATTVAKRFFYCYDWIPRDDIIGYAREGLVMAADRFDSKKGFKFTTYAGPWVRNEIRRGIIKNEHTIQIPEHKVVEYYRSARAERENPSEIPPDKEKLSLLPRQTHSLDVPLGDDGDAFINFIPDKTAGPERKAHELDVQKKVSRIAALLQKQLGKKQWHLLSRVSGYVERAEDGDNDPSITDAGREIGIMRPGTAWMSYRSSRRNALKILRKNKVTEVTLKEYFS